MSDSHFEELEKNLGSYIKSHISMGTPVHPHNSNGMKASHSLTMQPLTTFSSWIRNKAKSTVPNNFNNSSIDIELRSKHFTQRILLELVVRNIGAANISVDLPFLINYIEILESNGSVMSTIHADSIYHEKLYQPLDYVNRIAPIEGYDVSSGNYQNTLAAGETKTYYLHIPTWIDSGYPKLGALKDDLLFRIYFSNLGCDTPNDLQLVDCSIFTHGKQLHPRIESSENRKRSQASLKFRYLEPVRGMTISRALQPSSEYDFELSSLRGYYSHIVFHLRAQPYTYANNTDFIPIDEFELRDAQNNLVAITIPANLSRFVLSQEGFTGDVINKKNIYLIPFALSAEANRSGSQSGGYFFTGNERLVIRTRADLTPQAYLIQAYGYEYNMIHINKGLIRSVK